MLKWEDLTTYQKAAFWIAIGIIGWLAPEIALLLHFGGIEVVFAFLACYCTPIIRQLQAYYGELKHVLALAYVTLQTSALATPRVFWVQAAFCLTAISLTGSIAFSASFFMPGMMFNSLLT